MKVLWVVNHIMPSLAEELSLNKPTSGGWLVRLSEELVKRFDIELYIICPGESFDKFLVKGIVFITIPLSYLDRFYKSSNKTQEFFYKIVLDVDPSVVHVQGTEFCFNSAYLDLKEVPVIFSIQGLISEITQKKYDLVGLDKVGYTAKLVEYIRSLRDVFRSKSELDQLRRGKYFIGRTLWDEAHTYFNNTERKYFFSPEIIRKDFFEIQWDINKIEKYSIFCAGGYARSLKGFHNILYIASLLKKDYPELRLIVPGDDLRKYKGFFGYKSDLKKLLFSLQLENMVSFTGALNSEEMAKEFACSHVYLMGSSIENSSNTLCEAMCIGVPSVVPFVGGVPSLIDQEKEALFYQSNDNVQAAWQIKRLFDNDELCNNLSNNSILKSAQIYKYNDISNRVFNIYNEVLNDFTQSK